MNRNEKKESKKKAYTGLEGIALITEISKQEIWALENIKGKVTG